VQFFYQFEALLMQKKLSYEELEKRIKALEKQVLELTTIEDELRGSGQKYLDLFENAPIAYFSVITDDGSILRVNSEAVRLLGYKKDTIKRMKVFDLYADTPPWNSQGKGAFRAFPGRGIYTRRRVADETHRRQDHLDQSQCGACKKT
jgi:PAS domain S-box-containing protein